MVEDEGHSLFTRVSYPVSRAVCFYTSSASAGWLQRRIVTPTAQVRSSTNPTGE